MAPRGPPLTHVSLAGAVGLGVPADEQAADGAVALQGVYARGEREHGPLLGRGELHLRQVVDEEVQLGGHAAQAGLD